MSPKQIGRYEIIEEIGRGGMATVYSARDPLFKRNVAIKMLPAELLQDPNFRARFEREALLVGSMEHPAIVPVYDFGESDGQPYFVMRLMSGDSLAQRIAKGPMPIEECARIFSHLAPALDEAHERGIVHRDIKPENILFDQYDEPYLSDFGIAKLSETSINLTGSTIMGTPAYMSPEQARGEADLDGRSDIYSLGAILFQMLTGRIPYEADTAIGQVYKHTKDPIPDVLALRPDLPAATQEIIMRTLAKGKFARYDKANELAKALTAVTEHMADSRAARPPRTPALRGGETHNDLENKAKRSTPPPRPVTPEKVAMQPSHPVRASHPPTPGQVSSPRSMGSKPKTSEKKRPESSSKPARSKGMGMVWVIIGMFLLTVIGVLAAVFLPILIPTAPSATPTQGLVIAIPTNTIAAEKIIQPSQTLLPSTTAQPAPPTSEPTPTTVPSPLPSATQTEEPSGPIIGQADKIAFFKENDVWIANLDGSGLRRLTTSGGIKSNLQWTPDGEALVFVIGQCVNMVTIGNPPVESAILCANWADYLADFKISPDGSKVAISLSDGLFIMPYDLALIKQIRRQDQLLSMNSCVTYTATKTEAVHWSNDGLKIATVIIGTEDGKKVELIRLLDVSQCGVQPKTLDEFPGTRFTMRGYAAKPVIQSFGWDGETIFVLNVDLLDGFGDIYRYNTADKNDAIVSPLGNLCCFRDFSWSPNGDYFLFAFEDNQHADETLLYYIPYNTIGTGLEYTPIALPEGFLARAERPQPVLRIVK